MRLLFIGLCVAVLLVWDTRAASMVKTSITNNDHALSEKSTKTGGETLLNMPNSNNQATKKKSKKIGRSNSIKTASNRFRNSNDKATQAKLLSMMQDEDNRGKQSGSDENDFMSKHQTWLTDEGSAGKMMDIFRNDPAYGVSENNVPHEKMQMPDYHEQAVPKQTGINSLGTVADKNHLEVMNTHNPNRQEDDKWNMIGRRKAIYPFRRYQPHMHSVMPDEDRRMPRNHKFPMRAPHWNKQEADYDMKMIQPIPRYGLNEKGDQMKFLPSMSHDEHNIIHRKRDNDDGYAQMIEPQMKPRFKHDLAKKRFPEDGEWHAHHGGPRHFRQIRNPSHGYMN